MKKLKLKALELGATEMLTRAQLKNVLGGGGGVTTTLGCSANATCSDGTKLTCSCHTAGSCSSTPTSVSCDCNNVTTGKSCPGE